MQGWIYYFLIRKEPQIIYIIKGYLEEDILKKKILDIGPYQMDEKLYWNQARENLYVENIEDQEYKKEKEQEIVYYKNKEGKLGYYDEGCFYWNKEEGRLFFYKRYENIEYKNEENIEYKKRRRYKI